MPINATYEFAEAQKKYDEAKTPKEKLTALKDMLSTAPTHKGAEKLRAEIKQKIAKFKGLAEKSKKGGSSKYLSIKKEGAARVSIIGIPNSGKSTLLKNLTGSNPKIADYPYTTIEPEIGTMDYRGVKIQVIELPAIDRKYIEKEKGLFFLSIAKTSDLLVAIVSSQKDKELIESELKVGECNTKTVFISQKDDTERVREKIWNNLHLIRVYTKTPGKEKENIPVALKKNSTIEVLAKKIHKDFVKKFRFARIWGKSAKFPGQNIRNLNHVLKDEDVVELHEK